MLGLKHDKNGITYVSPIFYTRFVTAVSMELMLRLGYLLTVAMNHGQQY